MPFGIVDQLGPRMRQVEGVRDCPMRRDSFGLEYGASHCNQWGPMGTLWHSCAKVHEAVELPFGLSVGWPQALVY